MRKTFLIAIGLVISVNLFSQSNTRVSSMEKAKYFSIGSFVTVSSEVPVKESKYEEVSYKAPDGGHVTLLRASDDETPVSDTPLSLKVYPNPTNGIFSLETNLVTAKNIFIYDVLGHVVYSSTNVYSKIMSIDLSSKSRGIYIVKVYSGTTFNVSRITIQ